MSTARRRPTARIEPAASPVPAAVARTAAPAGPVNLAVAATDALQAASHWLQRGEWQQLQASLQALPTPWPAAAHQIAGIAHAQAGNQAQAIASFQAALSLSPADATLWGNLALVRYQTGDYAGAAQAARQTLQQQPQSAEAQHQLGLALAALGQTGEAQSAFRAALQAAPQHRAALTSLCALLLDQGNAVAALPLARQACVLAPGDAVAQWQLAQAAERTGQFAQARQASKRVLAIDPTLPGAAELALRLAECWWQPVVGRHLVLRRRSPIDADFLRRAAADAGCARCFAYLAGAGVAVTGSDSAATAIRFEQELARAAVLPPAALGAIDWVVRDHAGTALGLVSLVALDLPQRRAELRIGLPDAALHGSGVALEAALLALEFAFVTLGLEKLVSLVAADNPAAQVNALHLGFIAEGRLRGHWRLADGRRLDVYQNGLLAADILNQELLQALALRLLGRTLVVGLKPDLRPDSTSP